MNRLLTGLVILANAAGGALLAFHALGWLDISASEMSRALAYAAAGGAGAVLAAGLAMDLVRGSRAFGVALFLSAAWIALAPVQEFPSLAAVLHAVPPGLAADPGLVAALFLLVLARLAVHGERRPLGYALALLAPVVLCLEARLLGGPVYSNLFYLGLLGTAAAFLVLLTLGPEHQSAVCWTLTAVILSGAAYGLVT